MKKLPLGISVLVSFSTNSSNLELEPGYHVGTVVHVDSDYYFGMQQYYIFFGTGYEWVLDSGERIIPDTPLTRLVVQAKERK